MVNFLADIRDNSLIILSLIKLNLSFGMNFYFETQICIFVCKRAQKYDKRNPPNSSYFLRKYYLSNAKKSIAKCAISLQLKI